LSANERGDQGRIVIEATAAAADLSFVAGKTQPAGAPQAVRLCRRLRLAGAEPLVSDELAVKHYVLVGETDHGDRMWGALWDLRTESCVRTAFADRVMPQCPLLSAERGRAIVSPIGLQAPEDSAWVCMGIDLARFSRPGSTPDEQALKHCVETCVDVGERLHDALAWPTADVQHDAWLNRRLAIVLSGFGDLLRNMGMEPSNHDSLRYLNQLLLGLRMSAQSRSRAIAMRSELLPAIGLSDPSHALPRGSIREDWRRRWREAVRACRRLRIQPKGVHQALEVQSIQTLSPAHAGGSEAKSCDFTDCGARMNYDTVSIRARRSAYCNCVIEGTDCSRYHLTLTEWRYWS
jgi:hypothetical protein